MSVKNKVNVSAFKFAIRCGCNLVDTAATYQNGESERMIGRFNVEKPRKKLFVITKAGYVTEDERDIFQKLSVNKSAAVSEITRFKTTANCIHPDFLRLQIERSLSRLNSKSVNGFLLHNPEYYLMASQLDHQHDIYYQRIKCAFAFLEDLVQRGVISYYGVSSNTLSSKSGPNLTNLSSLIKISEEVSTSNHFKIVEFPYNLFEQQASQSDFNEKSMLSTIKEYGLISVGNRPLNCHTNDGFVRLCSRYVNATKAEIYRAENCYKKFCDLISEQLVKKGRNGDIDQFEIIQHMNLHWRSIGNHGAVDQLFNEYLNPFLETLFMEDNPRSGRRFRITQEQRSVFALFYKSCKMYSDQTMYNTCVAALQKLKSTGQISAVDTRGIPLIACENYLQKGLGHVLVGMTKSKYVNELRSLF